jgi:methyl-accepting chemotaxis protein/hemerythrin
MEKQATAFVWDIKMSVGIEVIDKQHQHFIGLLNKVYEAIITSKPKEQDLVILDELINYAVYHFQTEEELFAKSNYPDAAEHIRVHEELKSKVLDFAEKYKSGETADLINMLDFLEDWLVEHLTVYDQKYAAHISAYLASLK